MTRTMRALRASTATTGLVAVTSVVLLGSCGSGDQQSTVSAPTSTAPSPLAAAPSQAPPPVAPTLVRPTASDGTDFGACRDAACEVEVRTGDQLAIDARFGVDTITVDSLGPDEITLALRGTAGGFDLQGTDVSASSNCVNNTCVDEGELSLTTSTPGRLNDITLTLADVSDGVAVLALTPR